MYGCAHSELHQSCVLSYVTSCHGPRFFFSGLVTKGQPKGEKIVLDFSYNQKQKPTWFLWPKIMDGFCPHGSRTNPAPTVQFSRTPTVQFLRTPTVRFLRTRTVQFPRTPTVQFLRTPTNRRRISRNNPTEEFSLGMGMLAIRSATNPPRKVAPGWFFFAFALTRTPTPKP